MTLLETLSSPSYSDHATAALLPTSRAGQHSPLMSGSARQAPWVLVYAAPIGFLEALGLVFASVALGIIGARLYYRQRHNGLFPMHMGGSRIESND